MSEQIREFDIHRPLDADILAFVTHHNPDVDPVIHIYTSISCPLPDDMKATETDLLNYYITQILGDAPQASLFESFVNERNKQLLITDDKLKIQEILSPDPYADVAENSPKNEQEQQAEEKQDQTAGRAENKQDSFSSDDDDADQDPISAQIKQARKQIKQRMAQINKHMEDTKQQARMAALFDRKYEAPEKHAKINGITTKATSTVDSNYINKIKSLGKDLGLP